MKIHEIFRQPLSPEDYKKVQQIIEFYVEKGILKKEHYKILKNIEEKNFKQHFKKSFRNSRAGKKTIGKGNSNFLYRTFDNVQGNFNSKN